MIETIDIDSIQIPATMEIGDVEAIPNAHYHMLKIIDYNEEQGSVGLSLATTGEEIILLNGENKTLSDLQLSWNATTKKLRIQGNYGMFKMGNYERKPGRGND